MHASNAGGAAAAAANHRPSLPLHQSLSIFFALPLILLMHAERPPLSVTHSSVFLPSTLFAHHLIIAFGLQIPFPLHVMVFGSWSNDVYGISRLDRYLMSNFFVYLLDREHHLTLLPPNWPSPVASPSLPNPTPPLMFNDHYHPVLIHQQ